MSSVLAFAVRLIAGSRPYVVAGVGASVVVGAALFGFGPAFHDGEGHSVPVASRSDNNEYVARADDDIGVNFSVANKLRHGLQAIAAVNLGGMPSPEAAFTMREMARMTLAESGIAMASTPTAKRLVATAVKDGMKAVDVSLDGIREKRQAFVLEMGVSRLGLGILQANVGADIAYDRSTIEVDLLKGGLEKALESDGSPEAIRSLAQETLDKDGASSWKKLPIDATEELERGVAVRRAALLEIAAIKGDDADEGQLVRLREKILGIAISGNKGLAGADQAVAYAMALYKLKAGEAVDAKRLRQVIDRSNEAQCALSSIIDRLATDPKGKWVPTVVNLAGEMADKTLYPKFDEAADESASPRL